MPQSKTDNSAPKVQASSEELSSEIEVSAGEDIDRRALVVVVDDDRALCHLLKAWLQKEHYQVEVFHDGKSAIDALPQLLPDAVCLDLNMPGLSGLATLEQIRKLQPTLPVLILTADTNVDSIVKAMRIGAYDYLPKPIQRVDLGNRIRHAVEAFQMTLKLAQLERQVAGKGYAGIIGGSSRMRQLYRQMDRLSSSDITVLIQGESGTGKELVARALHQQSSRKSGPFVPVNCAAIPDTLQESELFGHEKGSFTGASSRRIGRFEQANRGTLFLDEVAELSKPAQAKLLRVLQEQTFTRVGGTTEISSEFRLIAATHRNLHQRVEAGAFRADLYFRIAVFELEVPPLRDRLADIPELVDYFQQEFAQREGRAPGSTSREALATLQGYGWPGNVRELQNAVQRGVVASEGATLEPRHLPPRLLHRAGPWTSSPPDATALDERLAPMNRLPSAAVDADSREGRAQTPSEESASDLVLPLHEVERKAILEAMQQLDGNISQVGKALDIGRTTLYRKLKQYGLR